VPQMSESAICGFAFCPPLRGAGPAGPVEFAAHDIDANFRGGYSRHVADFNKDGKIDVIANSLQAHGAGVVRESRPGRGTSSSPRRSRS
jgi:hypothetical protein